MLMLLVVVGAVLVNVVAVALVLLVLLPALKRRAEPPPTAEARAATAATLLPFAPPALLDLAAEAGGTWTCSRASARASATVRSVSQPGHDWVRLAVERDERDGTVWVHTRDEVLEVVCTDVAATASWCGRRLLVMTLATGTFTTPEGQGGALLSTAEAGTVLRMGEGVVCRVVPRREGEPSTRLVEPARVLGAAEVPLVLFAVAMELGWYGLAAAPRPASRPASERVVSPDSGP